MLMPGADEHAGMAAADGIRQRVEALRTGQATGDLPMRVSVGVAQARDRNDSYARVLRRADDALYEAKRNGRNRVMAASATTLVPAEATK